MTRQIKHHFCHCEEAAVADDEAISILKVNNTNIFYVNIFLLSIQYFMVLFSPMARLRQYITIAAFLFLTFGCVSRPVIPPPKEEIPPQVKKGLPLEGKVIVLDPGHGGKWRGAIGKNGFAEAEINLGVALYLFGFLKESGAEVILTRTTDREVAQGENVELRDDLQARCDIANQAKADLFISIHHNSDWGNPQRDEIQVYYQIADPGPSFDLAIETGVALFESIGPRDTDICPGNYYVLRNTHTTAILGEAAFLSREEDEKRLAFFRSLREEARAYYEGILNYLTKGLPRISGLMPNGQVLKDSPSEISWFIKDEQGIDPASLSMIMDGRQVKFNFDPATGKISHCPEAPFSNAQHSFRIEGRNIAGNAAKAGAGSFTVNSPPARITVSLSKGDASGVSEVAVEVLDRNALPVTDGTTVEIESEKGRILTPILTTKRGRAKTYLLTDGGAGATWIMARSGSISTRTEAILSPPSLPVFVVQVKNPHGRPVESAEVSIEGKKVFTDSYGYATVELSAGNREREIHTISVARPGYRPCSFTAEPVSGMVTCREVTLMSEDEGVLDRKTIIVDPEGLLMGMQMGSPDPERVNIHNVALARKLKEWLEAAGATCHITTEKDLFPTVIDRVLFSSEKKGDYFITVRHKERKCGVGYYFNSEPGKMLARSLRDSVSQTLGIPECRVSESSEFTIVQTEMPSVLITLPLYSLPEGRESNEAVLKETVALYQGMVQFFRGLK